MSKIAYLSREIVGVYDDNVPDHVILKNHAGAGIVVSDISMDLWNMRKTYHVVDGEIRPKPFVSIWPEKDSIVANGQDQCRVTVAVYYSPPIPSVTILVNGIPVQVNLQDNKGEFYLSCKDPGDYTITVQDEGEFACAKKIVEAK